MVASVTILSRCFVRSPSNPHVPPSGGWYIRLALLMHGGTRWDSKHACNASGRLWPWYRSHGVTKLSLVTLRGSVDHTHRRSTLYVDVLGVLVNLSGRHCECIHGSWRHTMRLLPLCGQRERWQTAGRPGRKTNTGHRDKTHGFTETSSTFAPTTWPRSARGFN